MARHKVEICGVNTANIKVLSNEDCKNLFIKMKNGDKSARDQLVEGNLKLVLAILKKFSNKVDNLEWCTSKYNIQEAWRIGLISEDGFGHNLPNNRKKVNQYNKEGKLLKTWNSLTEISKYLDVSVTSIYQCCRGKTKTIKGYKLEYTD